MRMGKLQSRYHSILYFISCQDASIGTWSLRHMLPPNLSSEIRLLLEEDGSAAKI